MKALVTRPIEDAGLLVQELRQRGIEPVIEPLLTIRLHEGASLDLDAVQALLFTSANGARAAAMATESRDLPVFAVGDATAAEARRLGWRQVESAAGAVDDLARLVETRLKPADGALLHVAGSVVAGDLIRLLNGFSVRRTVLYDAVPADALSGRTERLLWEEAIDLALFFSPRTAAKFAELAGVHSFRLGHASAFCLSPAVASAVAPLGWREVVTARSPTQAELLAALDVVLAGRHDARAVSKGDAMSEPAAPPPSEADAKPVLSADGEAPRVEAPQEKRQGSGAFWPVLALLLVLGAVAAAPFVAPALPWGPKPQASVPAEQLAALEQRLAAVERRPAVPAELTERLTRLEQRPQAAVPQDLAERLGRLEQRPQASVPPELVERIARLEQRPEANPQAAEAAHGEAQRLAGEVQTLRQRLAELERRAQAEASADRTDQALLLAVAQLRQATQTARPFAAELGAVLALAKERPTLAAELEKLKPTAEKGAPTVALLNQHFQKVAADIVRAEQSPPSEDWTDQVLAKLRSVVSVRRVGKSDVQAGAESAVAAAEQALAEGDLPGAVAAVETLQGAPAETARPWLDQARARLAVDAALAQANSTLTARLAQDGKS